MKILICLDYSHACDMILNETYKFLQKFSDADIYVHTVKDSSVLSYDQGFDNSVMNALESESEEVRKKAEAVFGNKMTFSSGLGIPVENILSRANELKCDLLILGTHGRTGLDHILMGSVAERVLRGTEFNILVIPSKNKSTANVDLNAKANA